MKHYLRFILVLLLSTVWCVGGYAQETVYSTGFEENEGFTTATNYQGNKTLGPTEKQWFVYYGCVSTNSKISGSASLQMRYYATEKKTPYAQMNFSVENVTDIKFNAAGEDGDIKVEYSVDDGKSWIGAKQFSVKQTVTAISYNISKTALEKVRIKITWLKTVKTGNAKLRIDDFQLINSDVTIKKSTTTTFGAKVDKQTFTITEGETFPTHVATMTTEGVAGTIAYASDNDAVNVDQNGVTSAGTGFGKAKITATFTPTDAETYASSSAYYYIDYKEKTKPATAISFDKSNVTLTTLDYASFTGQTATLKAGETILTNELTYSKEDAAGVITTLNNDGTLVLSGKAGTATVTATFNGSDEYASSAASYTVTVKEAIKDIATLKPLITATKMASAQSFTLKLTDAVVTYVNKNSAYIQDATAGIFVYASGHGLKNNQKINGLVDIKALLYSNLPEISSWTLDASAEITDDATFDIETVTIADLNANYSKYESKPVKIAGAIVTSEFVSNKAEISQDGNTYLVYNKGGSGVTLTKNDNIDIIGYPTRFNDEYNLYLWKQSNVKVNSTLVATTLSFDPAIMEYSVDNNNKDAFTAPTATVKDAEGNIVEGAAITYTSSEPSVATVGETDGKVTFVGFGTTVITANYAGDATHMASSSSYTINYGKVKTTMAWSAPTATANLGETSFDAPTLTLKAGDVDILDGKTITYSSSATDVAEISAEGIVKTKAEGTTVITATFAGDDTYAEASAEYTLTVKDPNKLEVTFDFTDPSKYGYKNPEIKNYVEFTTDRPVTVEGITISNTKDGSPTTRFHNTDNTISLRAYNGATLSIAAPNGYMISKVIYDDNKKCANFSCNPGTLDKTNQTWTGNAHTLNMSFTGSAFFYTIKVTCVPCPTMTLTEENNDEIILKAVEIENNAYNVTLNRTMIADGGWYTFCVPFDIENIATTPLKDAQVRKYSSMSGPVMNFEETTSLSAVHAYLVKPTVDIVNPEFKNVTVSLGDSEKDGANGYFFEGIYSEKELSTDGTNLFLGADNKFYIPTKTGNKMKALRGYFVAPSGESGSKMGINIDGETNYITTLNGSAVVYGKVYNLNGQYVGNDVKSLKKGVYVVNGRKFIVK